MGSRATPPDLLADPAKSAMQSACDPAVSTPPDLSTQQGDSNACSQSSAELLENSGVVSVGVPTAADLLPDPSYDPWDLSHTLVSPVPADTTPSIPSDLPTVLTKLSKWGTYTSVGSGACGCTRFIPMKTPLSHAVLESWDLEVAPAHPWTVALLLSGQAAAGRRVGMILDLSNHDSLYADEVPPSITYRHVKLVAKELPSREAVHEVVRVAQAFWRQEPDTFIAIHCAYGFNRTGFVVCSYLCEAEGWSVAAAMEAFAAVRPPGVKHVKFIDELYARYGNSQAVDQPRQRSPASSPPAPGLGRESADTEVAFSCVATHVPLAVGVRSGADRLARTLSHRAGAQSPAVQGLDGEDNESLQDSTYAASPAPSTARSSCRLVRGSPLGGTSVDRSGVTQPQMAVHCLLTEESLALQDAACAGGGSLGTVADSLPTISRAVSERCAEIAHGGGSQQSSTQQCQSPSEGADPSIEAPCSVVETPRMNQRPADSSRRKLCSIM